MAGWWRVSLSLRVLEDLDHIRKEMERETGIVMSYNSIIARLIRSYRQRG